MEIVEDRHGRNATIYASQLPVASWFDIITEESSFPTEPEKDFEVIHAHSYREMKDEMENAIRILKMTDEEVVSASTYNAIARYL